jgi:leader peptidase (prepilin peptidase) / N-methyltransferase
MAFILVFIYGWLAGIVVNALADDLPRRVRPELPHYPDGETRPLVAWSAVLAFLSGYWGSSNGVMLKFRHLWAEIGTLILCLATYSATSARPDASALQIAFWMVYAAIFALIVVIDIEHKLILFVVINPFVVLAVADAVLTGGSAPPVLLDALLGGALGYGIFFLMYQGGFLFTSVMGRARGEEIREVAFGYGDVMLAGVVGLVLGWKLFLFAMTFTIILGAIGALLYLVLLRLIGSRYSAFTALPYGPYIVAGCLIMLLYPAQVGGMLVGR